MQKKNFSPHRRTEWEYFHSIEKLLFSYLDPEGTPASVLRAFAHLSQSPEVLATMAAQLADRMLTQVRVSNARSWRAAAREASRGREIYEALQREMVTGVGTRVREIVEQNSQLITSIPMDVRATVNREILSMEQQGKRPEEIALYLRGRIPELTKHRAASIARTETGKAATALTRARSENMGVNWYQWATSEDERVRRSHRLMDKVLIGWDDAPSPEALLGIRSSLGKYHAGNAPNCRCDCWPVLNLNLIGWPARIYSNGAITRIKRAAFAELAGMRRAVA